LRGGMAAQGPGDGSPYPPPNTGPAGRPVIASAQPVATAPRAVVQFSNAAAPTPPLEDAAPPVPRPRGFEPVVPIPDDGLWSRRKLRILPPPLETMALPPPPEITVPPR